MCLNLSRQIVQSFRFGPVTCQSYASPAQYTANLPPAQVSGEAAQAPRRSSSIVVRVSVSLWSQRVASERAGAGCFSNGRTTTRL